MFPIPALAGKGDLLDSLQRSHEQITRLCSDLIRCGEGVGPANTSRAIRLVRDLLHQSNLACEVFEPQPGMQNLVASVGDGDGPVVVLNAHLDVFPTDDLSLWRHDPFGGDIEQGRIYGRGACDMKAGATASLVTFLLLASAAPRLNGKAVLMLVADEENGGEWGTDYLLSNLDLHVDACLVGEPSGTRVLRIGEKGQLWVELTAQGETYHSGIATGDEPVGAVAEGIHLLRAMIGRDGVVPNDLAEVIQASKAYPWMPGFASRSWVIDHLSMNFGTIQGGLKTNIAPRDCRATVDIRLPFGLQPDAILSEIRDQFSKNHLSLQAASLLHHPCPATYTSPHHPLVQTAVQNIAAITDQAPTLVVSPTFTDARFFRIRGYPTLVYGPSPHAMAGPDEYVEVSDLMATVKAHAAIAWDLLTLPAG